METITTNKISVQFYHEKHDKASSQSFVLLESALTIKILDISILMEAQIVNVTRRQGWSFPFYSKLGSRPLPVPSRPSYSDPHNGYH